MKMKYKYCKLTIGVAVAFFGLTFSIQAADLSAKEKRFCIEGICIGDSFKSLHKLGTWDSKSINQFDIPSLFDEAPISKLSRIVLPRDVDLTDALMMFENPNTGDIEINTQTLRTLDSIAGACRQLQFVGRRNYRDGRELKVVVKNVPFDEDRQQFIVTRIELSSKRYANTDSSDALSRELENRLGVPVMSKTKGSKHVPMRGGLDASVEVVVQNLDYSIRSTDTLQNLRQKAIEYSLDGCDGQTGQLINRH